MRLHNNTTYVHKIAVALLKIALTFAGLGFNSIAIVFVIGPDKTGLIYVHAKFEQILSF